MSASKAIARAQRHVTASKDTADDVKAMAANLPGCIEEASFFALPQDLVFSTIEAYKGELTEEQINKLDELVKKTYGHRAQKKFKQLETIVSCLASIQEAKAAEATPVAEEEDNVEAGEEEENREAGEEEEVADGIQESEVPEGLLRSIWKGDLKGVQHYIHKSAKMDEYFERVGYPLHCAVFQEKADIVEYLLKKGAKVNQAGALGQTPLHFACQCEEQKILNLLLAAKDINVNAKDDEGDTPLIVASRTGKVNFMKALIAKGANVNAQNNTMSSALHEAARYGQVDAAKLLCDSNANVSLMDNNFKAPFMIAIESGASEIAQIIQAKFSQANEIVFDPVSDDSDE